MLPDTRQFAKRLNELEERMAAPDFYADPRRAAGISREHQKLGRLLEQCFAYRRLEAEIGECEALATDTAADPELRGLAREELPQMQARAAELHRVILLAMLPPDAADSRNTILEIRAGTGGDEAALFAGDLYRMYTRYAEASGWKTELMHSNPSAAGGFKEIAILVTGEDVYCRLKFESGVHRVQRVPVTEASGRIHTSAATVAVLPEAEEVDIRIDPADLEIAVARASGPGGQGVNTTDSAVQILHKPTGMIVKCADERSQLKNKAKALKVLRSRLLEQKQRAEQEKYAAHRRSQIGSGDRSERIRTYNFPQGRVTDHRINLTLYALPSVMEGVLDELLDALRDADQAARLEAMLHAPAGT
jgi:peptide chain release factor 1